MENKFFSKGIVVFFTAMLCCALWGSATPFIKTGYELMLPGKDVPSTMLFAGIRFFVAGVLTVMIYSIGRRKLLFPKKQNIGKVATVSLFQTVIQYIFFYIGLANTTGVKGTVISGSSSFFSIVIASLVFRQEKLTLRKILACILGFAGIILVNLKGLDLNMNLMGDGFVLFSTIAYAVSSVLMKRFSKTEDPVVISGYQFVLGGLVMILIGFFMGGYVRIESISAVLVLLYLAILSAMAYSLWGILLKHNPVSKVTVYTFMTPVFGVILSEFMLSEQSGVSAVNLVSALILIASGLTVLNYQPKGK